MASQIKKPTSHSQAAYSLIELLMAMAIFSILVTTLFTGFIATREGKPQQAKRQQASALFQETVEALRVIREQGWDTIATNGTYYPVQTADSWQLAAGSEVVDAGSGLTRSLLISDVYRDSFGNITLLGGTLDPSSKAVTITIAWDQPLVSSYSNTIYLTRYLDNLAFIDTTVADFSRTGHLATSVVFTAIDDGEITLDAAGPGRGNWCEPGSAAVSELDLPRQGAARAITAIQGKVFSGTGANASGVSLAYVTVTDTIPPVTTLAGTFDGYKTNDVFGTDQYGFLATDTNNREVVIVNLNNMTLAGYFDAPGAGSATSIFVLDNVGYTIIGTTLYRFDLSTVLGSSSQPSMGSISLGATGNSVYVVDNVAYVTLDATSNQLRLVDVSNPSTMSLLGSITVNGAEGRDVYVAPDGNRAYLVTKGDAAKNEFFIINTANKNSLSVVSSYDTNGMDPKAVDLVLSGNRAVIVGVGGEEYQVVTISPETNPTRCGGFNEDSGIWDIATVVEEDTDAYAYINTGQASSELKVIEGGPGGSYSMTGQYESAAFDTGTNTAYNRLSFTGNVPEGTSLRLQVAGTPLSGGSCADSSYSFVGPDNSDDSFFTSSPVGIPFDNVAGGHDNPARCFKYKAFFDTTDILLTPRLEDVTINYSP
jgi:prepilin-type N-terminal cleavage/methylation domain-containing protein